jgi:phage terminase large subunit GpA-like protein
MSDIHPEIQEGVAEERGYDRGFTAGTLHAHELLNKYLVDLKHQRTVAESEGWVSMDKDWVLQHQINLISDLKLMIRKGFYDQSE